MSFCVFGTRKLTWPPFFLHITEGGINDIFAQKDEYVSFRCAYYFVKSLKPRERNNAHFDDGIAFISLPNLFLFYFTLHGCSAWIYNICILNFYPKLPYAAHYLVGPTCLVPDGATSDKAGLRVSPSPE